jgi:2-iminobutanoate/2-iminopropanoate deaminase
MKLDLESLTRVVSLSLILLLPAVAADKQPVRPAGSATAGPYTPGILAGGTLYVAGQVGRDAKTLQYPSAFEDEVKLAIENAEAIVKAAGYTLEDAVNVQVYMTDMSLFDQMNSVYMKYFPEPRPARATVGVAKLVGPARIEISITAWKKQK